MGLTHYPHGVASFGMPVLGMGEETMTTGNVFFVDSGAANASDGNRATSPDAPAATIDGCIAKCTANNGDIIFVMPGHDENPTSSITMDIAGVWIRGLGWGADRPTVTFGAAAACVAMSAASCRVSNIRFDLGTVAHATSQFNTIINADTSATRLVVRNNRFLTLTTDTGTTTGFELNGCDQIQIYNNLIFGNFSADAIDNDTDEILDAFVFNNIIRNTSITGECFDMDANATGIFVSNHFGGGLNYEANVTGGLTAGATAIMYSDNWMWDSTAGGGKSGGIFPVARLTS
ncbi:hypothetical protein AMJ82_11210 [candidate division TA06 bacterium SM23_40]|uniref:Right handed beta helix domain-containing protein n=1 Tax=candidate division TA06 bacterium SM23_40 TaxID=1703774 RepID=A0A0S8G2W5_UNCT6|nr:MAG: hypothetical protein AMJ82_11210 [candidate division TA06 bacterium SM23_40]